MTNKNILLKLQELSLDDKNRSMAARLNDLHEAIEETLKKGISRALVIKELNSNGFEIKSSSFNTTLARLRKKRSKESDTLSKSEIKTKSNTIKSTQQPTEFGSHDPRALTAIFNNRPDLEALSRAAKKNRAGNQNLKE